MMAEREEKQPCFGGAHQPLSRERAFSERLAGTERAGHAPRKRAGRFNPRTRAECDCCVPKFNNRKRKTRSFRA